MNVARTRTRTAALGSFGRRTSRYASSHIFPNAVRRRTEKRVASFCPAAWVSRRSCKFGLTSYGTNLRNVGRRFEQYAVCSASLEWNCHGSSAVAPPPPTRRCGAWCEKPKPALGDTWRLVREAGATARCDGASCCPSSRSVARTPPHSSARPLRSSQSASRATDSRATFLRATL